MPYGILADIVVLIHLGFVIFVVMGAVLSYWRRWIIWLHLPSVGWAVWIETSGGICPLTPLENWLRIKAGQGPLFLPEHVAVAAAHAARVRPNLKDVIPTDVGEILLPVGRHFNEVALVRLPAVSAVGACGSLIVFALMPDDRPDPVG